MSNPKQKIYYIVFILLSILIISLISYSFFYKKVDESSIKSDTVSSKTEKTSNQEDNKSQLENIFKTFVNDFNTHDYTKIDKYMDPKLGMVLYYQDGYYPIIELTNSLKNEIDWFSTNINNNVIFFKSPEYIGDGKYSEKGFFVNKNNGSFLLKNFDNSYVALPNSFFEENKILEKSCNYKSMGISNSNGVYYDFYFKLESNKLILLGIASNDQSDSFFTNPSKPFISFNTEEELKNFITEKKYFYDKQNKAYIDFSKKEFTYIDFESTFEFESYVIEEIKKESKLIKSAKVVFYATEEDKEDYLNKFEMTLTNKGEFLIYPMGARPSYRYE